MNTYKSFFRLFLWFVLWGFLYGQTTAQPQQKDTCVILIGDTQRVSKLEFWRERNAGIARKMYDQVTAEHPVCLFHLGDMVFFGAWDGCWKDYEYDAANFIKSKIPMYPCMGNHDYYGLKSTCLEHVYARFPFLKERTWYSKTIRNAAFILLNSNFSSLSKEEKQAQLQWYTEELKRFQADNSIDYIFVMCHHAPFTNSTVINDNKKVQKHLLPPFLSTPKAKVFFTGHAHGYEHFRYKGKEFVVTGGGGGARPGVSLTPKDSTHVDIFHGPAIRDFNYCKISFTGTKLKIEMIALDQKHNKFYTGETIFNEE